MTVTTWRYTLNSCDNPRDSWSIVFVDSTGCFSVLSDHGDWAYRWVTQHTGQDDFRKFLVQIDSNYLARKIGRAEDNAVFDGDRTRQDLRKQVIELRREGRWTRDRARREWDLVGEIEGHPVSFDLFLQSTTIEEAWEFRHTRREFGLDHWSRVSFPRLKEVIRAELAREIDRASV